MPAEVKKEIHLEIAHVLFINIVGYSKLSINEQRAVVDELTQISFLRGSRGFLITVFGTLETPSLSGRKSFTIQRLLLWKATSPRHDQSDTTGFNLTTAF